MARVFSNFQNSAIQYTDRIDIIVPNDVPTQCLLLNFETWKAISPQQIILIEWSILHAQMQLHVLRRPHTFSIFHRKTPAYPQMFRAPASLSACFFRAPDGMGNGSSIQELTQTQLSELWDQSQEGARGDRKRVIRGNVLVLKRTFTSRESRQKMSLPRQRQ